MPETPAPSSQPAPENREPPAVAPAPATDTPAPAATGDAAKPAPDGGGTLGAAGGGEDKPAATPATWPTNWRDILAGGDEKFLQRLNRFASPTNFAKSWLASQQKIASGELLRAKPEGDANDEAHRQALEEWRAQAGIPAKPEGYLENLPDGLIVGEADKPLVESFIADMHAADSPPALVHKAIVWYYKNQERIESERATEDAAEDKAHRATAEDELRAEWGPEYHANFNGIWALFDTLADSELRSRVFAARFADGTPFGDDPAMLKFLDAAARMINPRGAVTPAAGKTALQTIDEEIAQLKVEMADTKAIKYDYHKNPAKQARYRELLDLRDRHAARPGA